MILCLQKKQLIHVEGFMFVNTLLLDIVKKKRSYFWVSLNSVTWLEQQNKSLSFPQKKGLFTYVKWFKFMTYEIWNKNAILLKYI